jgi:hypothetical protein
MADIRNLRNEADKKRKEDKFFKTLRLQSKLAQQYNEAVMDKGEAQKLGVTPVQPQRRSAEEELNDYGFQRQTAFQNLMSLVPNGMTSAGAEKVINALASADNFDDLRILNQQWKSISDIASKQNNVTGEHFIRIFNRYKETFGEEGIPQAPFDVEDIGAEIRLALPRVEKAEDLPSAGDVLEKPKSFSKKRAKKPRWVLDGYDPTADFGGGDVARKTALFNELKKYQQSAIDALIKLNIPTEFPDPGDPTATINPLYDITGQNTIEEFQKLKPEFYQQALARIVSVLVDNNIWFNASKIGFGMKKQNLHRKGHSTIMLPREGNRRIVGRGVEPTPKAKYAKFGKFIIHLPSLEKGILNLKYTSYSNIANIPQQSIGSDMIDFLYDMLDSGSMNKSLFHKLPKPDQRLFLKISDLANIETGMGYKKTFHEEEREELDRFNLVKGIVLAGNNAPEVIKELKGFILKFLHDGRIAKSEGLQLLQEISVLV